MKRNTIMLLCAVALAFVLGLLGLRLAGEGATDGAQEDRLIGALVTHEYLDLFDIDAYLADNADKLGTDNVVLDGGMYEGRLYAELIPADGGAEYVFDGVDGYAMYQASMKGENGDEYTSGGGNGFSDVKLALNANDDGESISIEGTLYVTSSSGNSVTFYVNPIYQSDDGRVYVMSGSGLIVSDESKQTQSSAGAMTISADYTTTENGEKASYSATVKASISLVFEPERIDIIELDDQSRVINKREYAPDAMPEAIDVGREAEFVIVESHRRAPDGTEAISREIYDRGAETLEALCPLDDGVCTKLYISLDWA